jgi:hypothetical protein
MPIRDKKQWQSIVDAGYDTRAGMKIIFIARKAMILLDQEPNLKVEEAINRSRDGWGISVMDRLTITGIIESVYGKDQENQKTRGNRASNRGLVSVR